MIGGELKPSATPFGIQQQQEEEEEPEVLYDKVGGFVCQCVYGCFD